MAALGRVYYSFCFIALGGLLFGYIIGINSNVVTSGQLLCPQSWQGAVGTWTSFGYGQCYVLTDLNQGVLSAMNIIGATASSLFCFRYGDRLGRKAEVQLGALLYFTGSLIVAISPMLWPIYLGFFIYGLGVGFAMHAAPIYIAEISPAEIRGKLVSMKELIIVFGIFLGFLIGGACEPLERAGWRLGVGFAAAAALVMFLGISFVKQSPRWLVLQAVRRAGLLGGEGRHLEEAREALCWFRGASRVDEVEAELQSMLADTAASIQGPAAASIVDVFRYPKPMLIGCGLVFLQQVTGQPTVLVFAVNIFKGAGFGSFAAQSAIIVALVKMLATFFTVGRVDSYGRKPLLLIGIGMMIFALAIMSVAFSFRVCEDPGVSVSSCELAKISLPKGWAICTVVGLMFYVSGYQVGFGPISWLMISEIFPLGVRGAALSTAAVTNFVTSYIMTVCQTELMNKFSPAGVFFGYLLLSVVSFLFVVFVVIETKGKTLEEIERIMTGRTAAPVAAGTRNARSEISLEDNKA